MTDTTKTFIAVLLTSIAPLVAAGTVDGADPVPNPIVTGPTTGGTHGQPFGAMPAADVAQSHVTEAEYFYAGRATAFDKDGAWGMDGMWTRNRPRRPTTRFACWCAGRPTPPRFNGVVVVEWLNVSSHAEGAADYMQMEEEIERRATRGSASGRRRRA